MVHYPLQKRFEAAYNECLVNGGYDILRIVFTLRERVKFKKALHIELDSEEAEFVKANSDNSVMKRCMCCGEIKPLSAFYRNVSNVDEHSHYCRKCERAKDDEYYKLYKRKLITQNK